MLLKWVDMEIGEDLALLEQGFGSRGMTSDATRAVARRAFGGVDQLKERHRDQSSFLWVSDMRRDSSTPFGHCGGRPGKHKVLVIDHVEEADPELRGQNGRLKTPFAIPSSMRVFGGTTFGHRYAQPFPIGEKV
jgi:hypothetical protein